jgi:hypothetical protein
VGGQSSGRWSGRSGNCDRGIGLVFGGRWAPSPRYLKTELMAQAAELLAAESAKRQRRVILVVDDAHRLEPAQPEELGS